MSIVEMRWNLYVYLCCCINIWIPFMPSHCTQMNHVVYNRGEWDGDGPLSLSHEALNSLENRTSIWNIYFYNFCNSLSVHCIVWQMMTLMTSCRRARWSILSWSGGRSDTAIRQTDKNGTESHRIRRVIPAWPSFRGYKNGWRLHILEEGGKEQ